MFPGSLSSQIQTWLAVGLIAIPIGTVIFGLILRPVIKKIIKINIKTSRSFFVQLCAIVAGWFSIVVSIFIGLVGVPRGVLLGMNLPLSTIVAALVYSKMIKKQDNEPIGMKKGLFVSIIMNGIAVLLNVPLKIIMKIIA